MANRIFADKARRVKLAVWLWGYRLEEARQRYESHPRPIMRVMAALGLVFLRIVGGAHG